MLCVCFPLIHNEEFDFLFARVAMCELSCEVAINKRVFRVVSHCGGCNRRMKMLKTCTICGEDFNGNSCLCRKMRRNHMKKKVLVTRSTKQMKSTKTCTTCGVQFNNKSNLNRHIARFHAKKRAQALKSEAKTRSKVHHSGDSMRHGVLNEVLWQLLLKLLDYKNECDVARIAIGVDAASVGGDS